METNEKNVFENFNMEEANNMLKDVLLNLEFGLDNTYVIVKDNATVNMNVSDLYVKVISTFINRTLQEKALQKEDTFSYRIAVKSLEYTSMMLNKDSKISVETDEDFLAFVLALQTLFKIQFRKEAHNQNLTTEITKEEALKILEKNSYESEIKES